MDQKRLDKLRREIDKLRPKGDIKGRELRRLAEAVGRKLSPRGKEPTWISERFPNRPLSIPGHTKVNRFTAMDILDQLEQDLDEIEATISDEQGGGFDGRG